LASVPSISSEVPLAVYAAPSERVEARERDDDRREARGNFLRGIPFVQVFFFKIQDARKARGVQDLTEGWR
jgi:hypothetical protein